MNVHKARVCMTSVGVPSDPHRTVVKIIHTGPITLVTRSLAVLHHVSHMDHTLAPLRSDCTVCHSILARAVTAARRAPFSGPETVISVVISLCDLLAVTSRVVISTCTSPTSLLAVGSHPGVRTGPRLQLLHTVPGIVSTGAH